MDACSTAVHPRRKAALFRGLDRVATRSANYAEQFGERRGRLYARVTSALGPWMGMQWTASATDELDADRHSGWQPVGYWR
jgi:hypothetical protein